MLGKVDETEPTVRHAILGLSLIGSIVIVSRVLSGVNSIFKYFLLPRKDLASRYGRGSWALITGASDGIGKQYALELAREGFNIVLMGRDKAKTEEAASEVR